MKKAFTLIELMTVIAITATIVAAGLVNFRQSNNRQRIDGAAERAKQAFAQAHANAQSGKKDCEVCNRNPLILPGLKTCGLGDDPLQGWSVGVTPAPPLSGVPGAVPTPAVITVQGVCGPINYPNPDTARQIFSQSRIELPGGIQISGPTFTQPILFQPVGGALVPALVPPNVLTFRVFDMTDPTLQKCFTINGSGGIAWKTGTCP